MDEIKISNFRRSDDIGQLALAMSKFQGAIKAVPKSAVNDFLSTKYADLAVYLESVRKPLADNELAILQFPSSSDDSVTVETLLAHSSGQWVAQSLSLPAMMKKKGEMVYDAQSIGSAITYARRYAIASILCLASEDDDGNAASEGQQKAREVVASIKKEQVMRLEKVALSGTPALAKAWEVLPNDVRRLVHSEWARIKTIAAKADERRPQADPDPDTDGVPQEEVHA